MNIFYEDSGQFQVAEVMQKTESTYQVKTLKNERKKIKSNHAFIEFEGDLLHFLNAAQSESESIDTQLLWEVCAEQEFTASSLAEEYFGHTPSKIELAAILMALYAAPAHFYKKGKGVFKAAPEEILKQALASIERKKQQDALSAQWIDSLKNGILPDEIAHDLKNILHNPSKQDLTFKAFNKAASEMKLSLYDLAKKVGGVSSLPQFLRDGFEIKHFPRGIGFPDIAVPEFAYPALANGVRAFSIDDESTTEVDDALSVQTLANNMKRVGIHIAAPAFVPSPAIEQLIEQRQSTAYFPNGKITMLPPNWIQTFSLDEGSERVAMSIYFDVDEHFQATYVTSQIERVWIEHNLRIQHIEPHFNHQTGLTPQEDEQFPHHHDLIYLHQFAIALQKQRNRYDEYATPQFDYSIELNADGTVAIIKRERGSPIDTLVSEMMILANSTWANMLHNHQLAGLFRVQTTGKVRMSTHSEPHIGMGLEHYGWFTSPLRRAADFINQQQLLSLISEQHAPRFQRNDSKLFAALHQFESSYAAYNDFQRELEHYWSLVYLQQNHITQVQAIILKDDLVRLDGIPLTTRAIGIPFDLPAKTLVQLAISELDPEKQFISLNYQKALL